MMTPQELAEAVKASYDAKSPEEKAKYKAIIQAAVADDTKPTTSLSAKQGDRLTARQIFLNLIREE
jgi:hypothetical protein